MTNQTKDRLQKYLEYVRNTGGSATVSHFKEDWEPIGDKLWVEMFNAGLVRVDQHGRIHLTDAGVTRLSARTERRGMEG